MIRCVFDDEDCLRIFAEDQCWDKETLKQLKEEYNIYFMNGGDGVKPVMIKDDMVVIGWEDDGQIGFRKSKNYYSGFLDEFNIYWIKFLIADLQAALDANREKIDKQLCNCENEIIKVKPISVEDISNKLNQEDIDLFTLKKQAIKEFAEKLKERCHNYYPSIDHYCCSEKTVNVKDINELLKEY